VILFCADEFVGKAGETISQDVGGSQGSAEQSNVQKISAQPLLT